MPAVAGLSAVLLVGGSSRIPLVAQTVSERLGRPVAVDADPKNAIAKQFRKLFDMEGVELEIRPDALAAVARKALKRKTGARGLRTILESVLLDTMYELPSKENVSKVVVDESVVGGIHVQIGDEVVDGTVARRLDETRRHLAG